MEKLQKRKGTRGNKVKTTAASGGVLSSDWPAAQGTHYLTRWNAIVKS